MEQEGILLESQSQRCRSIGKDVPVLHSEELPSGAGLCVGVGVLCPLRRQTLHGGRLCGPFMLWGVLGALSNENLSSESKFTFLILLWHLPSLPPKWFNLCLLYAAVSVSLAATHTGLQYPLQIGLRAWSAEAPAGVSALWPPSARAGFSGITGDLHHL